MFEFQWNQRPSEPPGTPSRSAGTRPFRSSLLWMACSWSFALPLDGHWLYPFGGHNLLGAIVFFFQFLLIVELSGFCSSLFPRLYRSHVCLRTTCVPRVCLQSSICDGPRLFDVVIPVVFLFFPSRMQKREWFAMDSPTWMTILREDSSGNIDNLVGLPSGYLT